MYKQNKNIIWEMSNINLQHTLEDQDVFVKVTDQNKEEHRSTLLFICSNNDIKLSK